jgi:hypothetical protein
MTEDKKVKMRTTCARGHRVAITEWMLLFQSAGHFCNKLLGPGLRRCEAQIVKREYRKPNMPEWKPVPQD